MWRYASVLAVPALIGCAADSASDTWDVRREATGDTTTVHTLAGQVWSSDVELVEDVVIGVLDGPTELMFGDVFRLAEDPEGGIYVLDRQGPLIRHFDRTGEFIRTVGHSGEGPGEYQGLSLGMVVDSAGTLYMHDWGNGRIVRFAPDGQALDPWPLESTFLSTGRGTWLYPDGAGRLLVTGSVADHPALLAIEDGAVTDTLRVPRLPGVPDRRGGPYRIDTYWSWHSDGYFVVGVSHRYSLEAHRPSGVLRIRRDVERLPVHAEEAEAWRRRFEWMERQPAYRPPEGEWIPATMPPFRGVEVDDDGRIWVRRNTQPIRTPVEGGPDGPPDIAWEQPFLYDVFEADGTFLGEVRFPDRFEPHLFGSGHVWGVRRGELDEDYVVRLTVRES